MLSYRSTWEFVSTLEKCREARGATLLSCTYKFLRASIAQHSMRTHFIFLYFLQRQTYKFL